MGTALDFLWFKTQAEVPEGQRGTDAWGMGAIRIVPHREKVLFVSYRRGDIVEVQANWQVEESDISNSLPYCPGTLDHVERKTAWHHLMQEES